MLAKYARHDVEDLLHDLYVVVLQVVLFCELIKRCEAWVCNTENGVTVARDNLTVT